MAEKNSKVFVVATANEIQDLPPELIRKGRFDEIFFVDLPDQDVRQNIFDIHLRNRGQARGRFDLDKLGTASEGFSGAEIEQSIVSALYAAHAHKQELSNEHLLTEIRNTRPLSVVMRERIDELRCWATGRTVKAD